MNPNDPAFGFGYTKVTQQQEYLGTSHEFKYSDIKHPGLTIRQYFAGLAMQGLLATKLDSITADREMSYQTAIAIASIQYADALIEELNKQQ